VADFTALIHSSASEATIEAAVSSVLWADRIVVINMAGFDQTASIAESLGAEVITIPQQPWNDALRNAQLGTVETEWTFVLDSDESLAGGSGELIDALVSQRGGDYDAFAIPRANQIAGQVMQSSGWWPDRQVRLFRTGTVRYSERLHTAPEVLTGAERIGSVEEAFGLVIEHQNYPDLSSMIERQVRYAVTDHYDSDPESFDVGAYAQQAYETLGRRLDVATDGDLSRALATVMAWDCVIRALVHWDSLDPRPPLDEFLAVPITTAVAAPAAPHPEYDALLAAYEKVLRSKSWRLTAPLRRLRGND